MDASTEEPIDRRLRTILYVDDIAMIAESREELQDNLQKWQESLAENGVGFSVKETKFVSSKEYTEKPYSKKSVSRRRRKGTGHPMLGK
uniref:Reverse transcriptase domain-containing protein n=1 Tax=Haemonchus contortus TaxID=6289 RepID=A0A7I4YWD3_HAECO